jgi:glyceraldehyde 3-phosphate dehydrogenase
MKIAINGFGRIGRAVLRICLDRKVNVVAINDVHGAKDASYLLSHDSIYGKFKGKVSSGKDFISVRGKKIRVISEMDPEKLPWKKLGVSVVVECTGAFTYKRDAVKHIKSGAKKVIITAPGKNSDAYIVPGVDDKELKKSSDVISLASCTTNCAAVMLKVLDDKFGVKKAMLSTVHAYTNNQGLHDEYNKKPRRGRAAAENIVPTTTGAAEFVCKVIPSLKNNITGIAIRVPVAVGSLTDIVVELKRKVSEKEVNDAFRRASRGKMKGLLDFSKEELVSSDIIGDSHSAIVDGLSTQVNGNLVKVLGWYDNEYGYSCRVVDVLKRLKRWV